jgi:hypothetical protein
MPRTNCRSRGASRVQSGGASGVNATCPPSKFSFLSGCTSWTTALATLALLAVVVIGLLITLNRAGMLGTSTRGTMMIINDIAAKVPNDDPPSKHTNATNSAISSSGNITFSRPKELFEANDTTDDNHNGTGTPSSERIRYQVNPVIRDVVSYRQNPNVISYGRYEAEKNIERIINPLLPPERSYTNTYGIPINIPSRGPFQTYQQVGILSKDEIADPNKIPGNNNDSNILPLFGRPTYSGSNRWNYYTTSDKFQAVKLPINIEGRKCTDDLGCDELRDGDMVTIPSYNGRFRVEIYDFDKPRYIPFVY